MAIYLDHSLVYYYQNVYIYYSLKVPINLLPILLTDNEIKDVGKDAQRWLCVCCLRAIVEMSDTSLRQLISGELSNIQNNQINTDIQYIIDLSNEETNNIPVLDSSMDSDDILLKSSKNDRMELISAGSDHGSSMGGSMGGTGSMRDDMGSGMGGGIGNAINDDNDDNDSDNNTNDIRRSNKKRNNRKSKSPRNKNDRNLTPTPTSSRETPTSSQRGYRGEKVITATGLKGLRKENNERRRTGSPRSDASGSGGGNNDSYDRNYGYRRNRARAGSTSTTTTNKKTLPRKKQFLQTTLGNTVEDDIQRIKEKVRQKRINEKTLEDEKRKKSLIIREKMRKKFAHIKAIEKPLSPRKPGQFRKTKRQHVQARKLKAEECYATAIRVFKPWTVPLKNIFDHYIATSRGFIRTTTKIEDFTESFDGWSTMQQNEYLSCVVDLGIVPNMIDKKKALHIFHMVTTGANSPDTVNFDLFRSILLVISRHKGVICQDQTTDLSRANAFCSWLRIRNTRIELIFSSGSSGFGLKPSGGKPYFSATVKLGVPSPNILATFFK